MPGLGDALSKAMEDSRRGLDDLVRRAAEGESDLSQTEVTRIVAPQADGDKTSVEPEAESAAGSAPVSPEEKDFLVVALDSDGAAPPPPPPPGESGAGKTQVIPGPADDAGGDAVPGDAPAPPGADQLPEAAPPPPITTAVGSIAPFAPSGVIRRQLRAPAGGAKPDALPDGGEGEGGNESGKARRPLLEELAQSRRVPKLAGTEPYRDPQLLRGVDGAVRLIASGKLGRPAVLAFCGATPDSGTTTVAAAVALELAAQSGLRVLLVDADLNSPGLGGLIGGAGAPGLAEVLAGGSSLDAALVCSEAESLAVLPAGGKPEKAGASRPLDAAALGRMLDQCRGLFDAAIFDAGPVVGRNRAAELAGEAGTAVLVVRAGTTDARQARVARNALRRSGARVAGAILNCAPPAPGK